MDAVQLHLMLNHFPIVGFIASGGLLLYALWRGSREARLIALVGIALSGLLVPLVLATGDGAEDVIEHAAGVSEALIHRHEEAAEVAGTWAIITGVAALFILGVERWVPTFRRPATIGLMVLVLISAAGVGWAGHLGGMIRHPELRAGNGALQFDGGSSGGGEHDDDDDRRH